jgi:predicted metal-binding membrane protein
VLIVLLSFAALAWLVMLRTSGADSMTSSLGTGMGQTDNMGMAEAGPAASMTLPLFLGMWVTMMVAMMFPSVAPMVVIYSRFSAIRNQSKGATAVFVGGYLLAWTLVGLLAFGVYLGSSVLMGTLSPRESAVVGGGALLLAGAYQLTRYKTVCLRHCRTPLDFMMHWRSGSRGGLHMGLHHGLFCLGCCWGLMLVLLTVGVMNLVWMALVAAVIFIEKVLPFGWATAKVVGVVLVGLGIGLAVMSTPMSSIGG